ncbi:MAG: hypothetical protein JO235_03505 [Chroococcidiopsidaceae cyanobacterium CP_BM_RX_35]|nr:hypothetical protein [Chroococcidiopsidaceae cyanobacterium CP_BM_RX_35]
MKVPVILTGTSYTSNPPVASWVDGGQRLNYMNIYAHTAPDVFFPKRPFLLRLAINKSAGNVSMVKQGQECRSLNQVWDFELTVLPEEILNFLPWTVSLVKAHDKSSPSLVQSPAYLSEFVVPKGGLFNNVWTEKAWRIIDSTMLISK